MERRGLRRSPETDAGRHPGEGREDDGEDPCETVRFGHSREDRQLGGSTRRGAAQKKHPQGNRQKDHDAPKGRDSQVRPPGQDQQAESRGNGQRDHSRIRRHPPLRLYPGEKGSKRLGKGDQIEGDGDRLREVEGDADRSPDRAAEGAADDEILTTSLYPAIGGDLRHGQTGGDRDQVTDHDNQHRPGKPHVTHGITEPEKENRAQDGADSGEEYRPRPEAVASSSVGCRL